FAADIERHLHDEPVEAGPPSAVYRFRKFAKRNRTPLATGGLLTLAMLVALGGIASGILERRARQARVTGQLEVILEEVARLEKEEQWHDALISARRAEPALAAGEAAPEMQERARQTLVDLELVQRLDEIRMLSGTPWGDAPERRKLAAQADQQYAAAFRQAGIDVDALAVKQASEHIMSRRSVAAALLPALDDWVAVRSVGNDEAATRRLIDVLRTADPDPWRQRVREALSRKDWPVLENLATTADLDRQPAATLSFLCAALRANAIFPLEIAVLRQAQWNNPADYWISHRLGISLIWTRSPHHVEEGIGYMRAAVALRPESAHAMMNLGSGHRFLRQYDQAIGCYRKAIELRPNYSRCFYNLGVALGKKGLHEEASAAFEEAIKLEPDLAAEAYSELSMIHSTRPDLHLRNPRRAAELAEKAVQIEPYVSNHWTALGVAHYRESQWQEARTALDKSLELGTDGTGGPLRWAEAIDWFFLAMSYWHMRQQDQARECYDRAVEWMEKLPTDDEQLRRFRAEAEELLKIGNATKP
ncbi:MAG: tetratricopeptide repeat protein, partial [Pirellulales bacterium]